MVGRTKTPTKADKRRFADLQEIGCVACRLEGIYGEPGDVHHILSGGRRMGHQYTILLCCWHHKSENHSPLSGADLYAMKGPTLAAHKREFTAKYGRELQLLDMVNGLLRRAAA